MNIRVNYAGAVTAGWSWWSELQMETLRQFKLSQQSSSQPADIANALPINENKWIRWHFCRSGNCPMLWISLATPGRETAVSPHCQMLGRVTAEQKLRSIAFG